MAKTVRQSDCRVLEGIFCERVIVTEAEADELVYHKQGIRYFDEKYRENIKCALEKLSSFHLHILETGELETVLEDFGVRYQEKNKWIVEAINKIAELKKEDIAKDSMVYRFLYKIVYSGNDAI